MLSSVIVIVALAYVGLLILAAGCANQLLFPAPQASYADNKDIIKLRTADGTTISAIHIRNPAAKYTILFSHGNGEDIGRNLPCLREMADHGFSVFAYDYHGYGTSEGKPSEDAAYLDIDAAYEYLTGSLQVPPDRILVHGRSIGGGPSVDLATRKKVAGLILESTFTSAFRTVTRIPLLPGDKFRNIDKIGRVICPVLVIHGRRDGVVPFSHGQQLYDAAKGQKQCLWIDTAGHNDCLIEAGEAYYKALVDFASSIESGNDDRSIGGKPQRY